MLKSLLLYFIFVYSVTCCFPCLLLLLCRLSILDVLLRAIEAISIIDGPSQEISSNKELFYLVCALVKFPDKAEVHSRS